MHISFKTLINLLNKNFNHISFITDKFVANFCPPILTTHRSFDNSHHLIISPNTPDLCCLSLMLYLTLPQQSAPGNHVPFAGVELTRVPVNGFHIFTRKLIWQAIANYS
jgi:hypothetical protein